MFVSESIARSRPVGRLLLFSWTPAPWTIRPHASNTKRVSSWIVQSQGEKLLDSLIKRGCKCRGSAASGSCNARFKMANGTHAYSNIAGRVLLRKQIAPEG